MGYQQPRLPILREGDSLFSYIKQLVRFLRDFTQAAWNADRMQDEELARIVKRLEKLEGKKDPASLG